MTATSPVQITSTTVSSNSSLGGAGIAGASGTAGGAGGDGIGGGIYLTNGGTAADQLTNDSIISNTVTGGTGGAGGSGAAGGAGGDVYGAGIVAAQYPGTNATQGPLTVSDSLIANNKATAGNGGSGTAGNAGAGGGVGGGGLVTELTGTLLENDTFYGNLAQGGSGQTSGNVYGAGIDDTKAGGLSIINVTVVANTAKLAAPVSGGTAGTVGGGGIANDPSLGGTDAKLLIENTLDSNNNAEDASGTNVATAGVDIVGPTETTVSNLFGNYNATAAPGITTANGNQLGPASSVIPGLASSLADNGGPTQTLALLPSSTALGAGNVADAAGTTDQRGDPRIVNGKVDIGAWKPRPVPP